MVLKGHRTWITDGRRRAINPPGNPGMATGGSGDVLTGLITALVCQGLAPYDAARLGVYLHGLAGDLAAEELGEVSLIASDLLKFLPAAFGVRKAGVNIGRRFVVFAEGYNETEPGNWEKHERNATYLTHREDCRFLPAAPYPQAVALRLHSCGTISGPIATWTYWWSSRRASRRDLIRLAGMELELSEMLGGRKVDMNTPRCLSRYFRDRVKREAEVQYAERD